MANRAFTFTTPRIVQAAAVLVLCVVGAVLPYFTLGYTDFASEPTRPTRAIFGAGRILRTLSITYLPSLDKVGPNALQHGVDVTTLGVTLHEVGLVAAIVLIGALFMNEINKFLWWGLLLSGCLLIAGTVALFVGRSLLRADEVDFVLRLGWVPLTLAGALVLVLTLRARKRIDSYRGV